MDESADPRPTSPRGRSVFYLDLISQASKGLAPLATPTRRAGRGRWRGELWYALGVNVSVLSWRHHLCVGVTLSLGACTTASTPAEPTWVVFLSGSTEDFDGAQTRLMSRLNALAQTDPDVTLLAGTQARAIDGTAASDVLAACGGELPCIGRLGRALAAEEVVLGRLRTQDDGTLRLQFLVIQSETGELVRRHQVKGPTLDALEAALEPAFAVLSGAVKLLEQRAPTPAPKALVATAEELTGTAWVRPAGGDTWKPLTAGQTLRPGDALRTDAGGYVRVAYEDGSHVNLTPKSEVALEAPHAHADLGVHHVAVRSGSVEGRVGRGAEAIAVRTPDGEMFRVAPRIAAETLAFRVQSRDDTTVEVAVQEGAGVITTGRGVSSTVAAGEAQDVRGGDLAGPKVALPDFPNLQAPGIDATLSRSADTRIAFSWKPVLAARGYQLQISQDPSFRDVVADVRATRARWSFVPVATGTYYWRVASLTADGRRGEFGFARRLYVKPETIPDLLISPKNGADLRFDGGGPRFVTFAWRAAVPPAPYALVVAKEANLKEPVFSLVTGAQEVMTRELKPGSYFWGVYVERRGTRKPIFRRARALTVH